MREPLRQIIVSNSFGKDQQFGFFHGIGQSEGEAGVIVETEDGQIAFYSLRYHKIVFKDWRESHWTGFGHTRFIGTKEQGVT